MPRLRDGVIKRGGSWSYVTRVPDPVTGVTKPKWVGGFDTEDDAKAARDEARVRARRGEYVNRSTFTVADYLAEWVEAHASTVKPKTLAGYRHDIDHYIVPRIGQMRLQALRPAVISKLYRDLADHGGRNGRSLSAITVSHIHRTLRKALADAVDVEQLLAANPAARSKRPKGSAVEPIQVWTPEQLGSFLAAARSHRLFAFYRLAAYTGARRGELLYLRWSAMDFDAAEVTLGGSTAVVRGQRVEGTTKGGRSRTISLDHETVAVLREHRRQQTEERLAAGSAWNDNSGLVFTSRWGEPLYPDTVTALITKLISQHNKSATPPAKPLPHARLHDLRHLHATTLQGRPRPHSRRSPRPRRPGRDVARLLPRPPRARGQRRRRLRPGRQSLALANPLARRDSPDDQQQRSCCSEVVVRGRIELPTFRFSGGRSYQLSYLTLPRRRADRLQELPA
jgi:integrase